MTPDDNNEPISNFSIERLDYAPLTKFGHNEPDLHLIGESIAPPSEIENISTSASSLGDSPTPAREDHVHYYATPTVKFQPPCARLTGTTGVPVTISDLTSIGTIYWTPYKGNTVFVYSGTAWVEFSLTEISLALTATSGNMYDVFVYSNAGVLTLEILIWTNTTTRATALVLQDGVLVKSGATTRLYIGSFYATSSNTTKDSIGGSNTGGFRCLWNYYNRVTRRVYAFEATSSWAYGSTTWRGSNNTDACRVSVAVGVSEDTSTIIGQAYVTGGAGSVYPFTRFGVDSTTTKTDPGPTSTAAAGIYTNSQPIIPIVFAVGFHYVQLLESTAGGASVTFIGGTSGDTNLQASIYS